MGETIQSYISKSWRTIALIVTVLLAAVPAITAASDNNVSSLTANLSNTEVSATGVTLTLTLTTTTQLNTGTEIIFNLTGNPSGFNLSSVTGNNISASGLSGTAAVSSQNNNTFFSYTLNSNAQAGTKTITVGNTTNPSSASMGTVTLSTTGFGGLQSGATTIATVTVGSNGGNDGGNGGPGQDNPGGDNPGQGGAITGDNTVTVTITDEAGAALVDQNVFGYCGMSYSTDTTDSTGVATLENLADGNCGVWMRSPDYYTGAEFFSFAIDGTVKTQAVALTAIALDATVEVTLTDPSAAPVANAYIFVTDAAGHEFSGPTNASGQAEIGVVYGTYTLDGYLSTGMNTNFIPQTTFTVSSTGISSTDSYELAIQLQSYTSFIAGTITSATTGLALSTPEVMAYSDAAMHFSPGNADGTYQIGVIPGTYTVKAEKSGYANGTQTNIAVGDDETVSNQNIALADADNTLNLSTVDVDGAALDVNGYVFCKDPAAEFNPASVYFKQLSAGSASFALPDGDFQCTSHVTGYISDSPTFTMSSAETEAGNITLQEYNATLAVTLVDQDGNALANQRFGVFGTATSGNTLNGYSLGGDTTIGAIADTYTIRVFVMGGGYMSDYNNPTVVTLTEGETTAVTMTVYQTTATISGTLTDSADTVVADATVKAHCVKSNGKIFDFTTQTDSTGDYHMGVIAGSCTLNAASPTGTGLSSGDETETVGTNDAIDHDLQLGTSNASLIVTPSVTATAGSCYAYNSVGVYVTVEIDSDSNSATLPVRAGTWSYGCRVVSNDVVKVSSVDTTVDLANGEDKQVSAPVSAADDNFSDIVFQFSATSDNTITLPDGTTIFVPANALDTSGNVSIIASMATDVASEDGLAAGPAVQLIARDSNNRQITGTFNGNISITFAYTKSLLEKYGLTEADLTGGYTYKNGVLAVTDQGYTIDTENNTVTLTTNHFSTFTLAGAKSSAPSAPRHLQANHLTTTSAKLNWRVPSTGTVTKYKLQVRKHGVHKQSKWTKYNNVKKTHKLVQALLATTRYQFRVAACNGVGCSSYTDWKKFKTK